MENEHLVRVGSGGRFVIPAKLRKAIGLRSGDPVIIRLGDEGLIVTTPERAIRTAQALVRRHISGEQRLAEELMEERKGEAERD